MRIEDSKKNWRKTAFGLILCLFLPAFLAVGETAYDYPQSPGLSSAELLVLFLENWRDWLDWAFRVLAAQALLKCLM